MHHQNEYSDGMVGVKLQFHCPFHVGDNDDDDAASMCGWFIRVSILFVLYSIDPSHSLYTLITFFDFCIGINADTTTYIASTLFKRCHS